MDYSRRTALGLLGTGLTTGLAGCSSLVFGGPDQYIPLSLRNEHDVTHVLSFSIVSTPSDPNDSFDVESSDARYVEPGETREVSEAVRVGDTSPIPRTVLVMLETEAATRTRISVEIDETLRITVTETGNITVETRS
ncbi:hypothetical protein BRD20_07595 [Halobacteriales archaeon SW_8_65_20]|nr:MAG: hypothetical protein BRD20_07595 [Halobacteriales archaeon SW_8_65_20]